MHETRERAAGEILESRRAIHTYCKQLLLLQFSGSRSSYSYRLTDQQDGP